MGVRNELFVLGPQFSEVKLLMRTEFLYRQKTKLQVRLSESESWGMAHELVAGVGRQLGTAGWVDLLRGLAIFLVLMNHVKSATVS